MTRYIIVFTNDMLNMSVTESFYVRDDESYDETERRLYEMCDEITQEYCDDEEEFDECAGATTYEIIGHEYLNE